MSRLKCRPIFRSSKNRASATSVRLIVRTSWSSVKWSSEGTAEPGTAIGLLGVGVLTLSRRRRVCRCFCFVVQ